MNRQEIVIITEAVNSTINGDPDTGMQRVDEQGFGIVTDVCTKRMIREALIDMGHDILLVHGSNLHNQYDGRTDANLVENFIDVRLFGATITGRKGMNAATKTEEKKLAQSQLRGPVQFNFGQSIAPINPQQLTITAGMSREDDKERTIGNKSFFPHGVFRQHAFISAPLAEKMSTTEDDIQKLLQAITIMYDTARSASRMDLRLRGLYHITHHSKYGSMPAHAAIELVQVSTDSQTPSSWNDYLVQVDNTNVEIGETINYKDLVSITRVA